MNLMQTVKVYPTVNEILLSHSSLRSFASCPRKFEFRKIYANNDREESLAGEIGKCLHTGYQSFLAYKDRERAIQDFMFAYPMQIYSDSRRKDKINVSIEACYATLMKMLDSQILMEYEVAHIICKDGAKRPAIEVPFKIRIKDFFITMPNGDKVPVYYIGYVDAILFDIMEQDHIVSDIKTTRSWVDDRTGNFIFDDQCIPYSIVLEHMLGKPIHGFKFKIIDVYIDIANPKVRLYSFNKSRDLIEDWARGLLMSLKELQAYLDMQWFRRNGNACFVYNRNCQFMEMCQIRDPRTIMEYMEMEKVKTGFSTIDPWVEFEMELGA